MKKSISLSRTCSVLALLCIFTSPVQAQSSKDQRIDMLEEKIRLLTQEVEGMKTESIVDKQNIETVKSTTQQVSEQISVVEQKIDKDLKISMKPVPKFTHGSFSFQPFGRIHLDYAFFDDDVADHPNGAEFRRARMGMKGKLSDDFGYKIEIDFANENSNFKDVFINYTGVEGTEFRVGSFKTFTGLDNLTSANQMTFIERAAATSAFTASEIIGIGAITHRKNWSVSAGLFNDDAGTGSSDDEAVALNLRGTVAPINEDNLAVHLGASGRYKKPDQSNDRFDFDSRAENAIQAIDSVSARFDTGDNAMIYGLEAGVSFGPFHSQAEYFMADVERNGNLTDLNFDGGYIEAGYFLTGEHRSYNSKKGVIGGIKPKRPFDLKNGGWGAWQVAARYSMLDVSDKDILGGEMNNYTIGLNWYPNNYMRFMANYIAVDTDNNAVTPNDDPNIFLFRSQLSF